MNHVQFTVGGDSAMHPAVLVALLLATVLILALPRRYVLIPLLLLSITIPIGQRLMIGPFHFPVFRILVAVGWVRLLIQRYGSDGHRSKMHLNVIDKAIILYTIVCLICYTIQWQDSAAFFDQLGSMYNILGFYFLFRFFIRDKKDVELTIEAFAIVALVVAACMFNEQLTGQNVLGVLGGVPEYTAMREGYLRSQGPFRVYLTAGAFGATLIPLFLALWHRGGSRLMAAIGVVSALTIAITSRTSTAISACLATVIGLGMWPFRDKLRQIRWLLVASLVALHLAMKAPVWALIARIDLVGGSTGWHRFKIIDNFIHHFWDWWLVGSNNYWSWEGGDDMWDTANQYVATGETTGLIALILFLTTIIYGFKYLGKARKAAAKHPAQAWFLWLIGVALFSNLVAFFGISYFDQTFIYWYALLAIIVAVGGPALQPTASKSPSNIARWPSEMEPATAVASRTTLAGC
jgi:hypothetical protein